MKKKELKKIAEEIAYAEFVIENSKDSEQVAAAKDDVLFYTSKITDLEDMDIVDDYVQDFLNEMQKNLQ